MDCKLRLSKCECTEDDLIKHFLTLAQPEHLVIVHEAKGRDENTKPHYHIWFKSIVTIPTIRTRLLKEWKITSSGNQSYSLSNQHHNWDIHVGYLFKHVEDTDNPTRIVYEPPDFDRQYYISQYDSHCKTDTEKDSRTKNQNTAIEAFVDAQNACTPREIAEAVCDYYIKHNMTFHKANIGAAVNRIWYRNGNRKQFVERVLHDEGLDQDIKDENANIWFLRQKIEELRMQVKYEQSRHHEDPE